VVATGVEGDDGLKLKSVGYEARLARDPFDIPDFDAANTSNATDELNLLVAQLVGLVHGPGGYIALVEDEGGEGYTLFEGDPVRGGRVTEIGDGYLIARVSINGMRQRVRLELAKEGD